MRIILPDEFEGVSIDYLLDKHPEIKPIFSKICQEKDLKQRPKPSYRLIDRAEILTKEFRKLLLDEIANLVDENWVGRSEMCIQFAILLHNSLTHLQLVSRIFIGTAVYFDTTGKELFRWEHAWVRAGKEVVDGNIDSISENPAVPKIAGLNPYPYWGPANELPTDRKLYKSLKEVPKDKSVTQKWWPELKDWIDNYKLRNSL